jgi:cytochrome bd-type quinol oxidase subunit 2
VFYEKVTYTRTRVRISGGLIIALIVVIALAANHKNNAHDATEAAKWFAIVAGTACLVSTATVTALVIRARKRRKTASNVIQLWPAYEADAVSTYPDMQAINPPSIVHNGEEYVRVITDAQYSRIKRNSEYGKGRHNG